MRRPTSFGFDEQTAITNVFQHLPTLPPDTICRRANLEFDNAVVQLRSYGIEVIISEDPEPPLKPNGVFPNNWVTTFPDGRIFLYPMQNDSRRLERSPKVIKSLEDRFQVAGVSDISNSELNGQYLEGSGVIIFDHANKIAYACISTRCDETLFKSHAVDIGYHPIIFHASAKGLPIYHTNIMLGIQSTTAVICSRAINDLSSRSKVLNTLQETGHIVVDISLKQLENYCGNVLEVQNQEGDYFLVLSTTAYESLTQKQLTILGRDKTLIPLNISTIEEVGGGSARCMMTEIFLRERSHRQGNKPGNVAKV